MKIISKKIQETNFLFLKWSFFPFFFFSLFFLYLLFFIRPFECHYNNKVAEYTNKTSNINKIITISSWRNQDRIHIEFSEELFNLELSSHSFYKITFASFRYLYSHNFSVVMRCWLIWLIATIGSQKLTDLACTFSQ